MSFSLGSLFHAEALKLVAVQVLQAAKPEIDVLIASVPGAAPFVPEADAFLAAIVTRLMHLAENQEAKASSSVTVEVKSSS